MKIRLEWFLNFHGIDMFRSDTWVAQYGQIPQEGPACRILHKYVCPLFTQIVNWFRCKFISLYSWLAIARNLNFLGGRMRWTHRQNRIKHPKLVCHQQVQQWISKPSSRKCPPNVSFPSVSPTSSSIISGKTSSNRCRVLRKVRLNFTASSARVPWGTLTSSKPWGLGSHDANDHLLTTWHKWCKWM